MEWHFLHYVEHVTWAVFVSKHFPWRVKAGNWLKYFSVPASGNNNPARLSCYSELGCLFSLSKHVRINLPLRSVCFYFFSSLPLPCYSRTCPSACLAICTFLGFSGAEVPGLLKGALQYQHSKYLFFIPTHLRWCKHISHAFYSPEDPLFLTFPCFIPHYNLPI